MFVWVWNAPLHRGLFEKYDEKCWKQGDAKMLNGLVVESEKGIGIFSPEPYFDLNYFFGSSITLKAY